MLIHGVDDDMEIIGAWFRRNIGLDIGYLFLVNAVIYQHDLSL